jgi:hypothetical protein
LVLANLCIFLYLRKPSSGKCNVANNQKLFGRGSP